MFALSESFDDEGEGKEAEEDNVEFLEGEKMCRKPLSLRKRRSISLRSGALLV